MSISGDDAYILSMDYTDEKLEGVQGFSPKITENADNTDKDYKLDIETADGAFTTPNLMANVVVDSSLNYYSQNPVQNRAVTNKFDKTVAGEVYLPVTSLQVFYVTVPLRYQEDTTGNKHLIILSDSLGDLIFVSGLSKNRTIKAYRVGTVAEPNIKKLYYKNLDDYYKAELYIERTNGSNPITIYGASGASSYVQYGGVTGLVEIEIENVSSASILDEITSANTTWSSEKISNDYSSKEYVAEQISNSLHLRKEIVTTIPTVDEAEENVIYMIKDATATGDDKYKEYQLINGAVVQTGDTSIDLSGYAKLDDEATSADTTWSSEKIESELGSKTYTSLDELGLTAPTTVGEAFMAMPEKSMLMLNVEAYAEKDGTLPTVTDIPAEYGVLTIDKWSNSRFRIEFNNSLGGSSTNVKQWIGTLKGNDGTGLKWKQVNTGNHKYTTMAELALEGSTATIQDVMDKVAVGDSVMIRTDAFNNNNWQTQCNGIQWGYLKIEKTMNGLSNIELQEVITPNRRYFGTQSSGKFVGWVQIPTTADHNIKTYTNVTQLGLSSPCSVIDIIKTLPKSSQLIYGSYGSETHNGGFITDAPATHGLLEVKKSDYDGCRATMTFTESATNSMGYKRKWVAEFSSGSGNIDTNGVKWHEVAYKAVADVGFTTINQTSGLTAPTGITMTDGSKVNYCIRNGICYVHIALQISSISAKVNSWTAIAELPKSVIEAVGAMNCEGNTVPECMPIRVSQAGKLTLMYKGTITSTSDWWSYSFSYPVTE